MKIRTNFDKTLNSQFLTRAMGARQSDYYKARNTLRFLCALRIVARADYDGDISMIAKRAHDVGCVRTKTRPHVFVLQYKSRKKPDSLLNMTEAARRHVYYHSTTVVGRLFLSVLDRTYSMPGEQISMSDLNKAIKNMKQITRQLKQEYLESCEKLKQIQNQKVKP